jgi:hypothetical protein
VKQKVRVASGQGFWGDSLEAPRQQVEGGQVDYLMLDYLAEVTMSILQKQKERDPATGYARDFVGAMESVLEGVTGRGVKVIANAGGVNPPACAAAIRSLVSGSAANEKVSIAVVTGDDLLGRLDELIAGGHALANMDTGEPLSSIRDRVLSANAYIGSEPIVEGLSRGANVVITGRSTDTALTMAPLRFEFGWAADDWDRLAAGIVAGHIIECGAQCSGGNCLHDWRRGCAGGDVRGRRECAGRALGDEAPSFGRARHGAGAVAPHPDLVRRRARASCGPAEARRAPRAHRASRSRRSRARDSSGRQSRGPRVCSRRLRAASREAG